MRGSTVRMPVRRVGPLDPTDSARSLPSSAPASQTGCIQNFSNARFSKGGRSGTLCHLLGESTGEMDRTRNGLLIPTGSWEILSQISYGQRAECGRVNWEEEFRDAVLSLFQLQMPDIYPEVSIFSGSLGNGLEESKRHL
ncbi:unnamed protein product [Allacma fusca]|uniref:Uncharacterized protein n=1 Tax=Allacma fusca TaxID=39272 RepID=A0A8J2KWX0_9HEXA|nr:unnamed protein product [Allacma fusca]